MTRPGTDWTSWRLCFRLWGLTALKLKMRRISSPSLPETENTGIMWTRIFCAKKGKCRIKCYLEDNEEAAAQLARVRLGMEDVKAAHSGEALGPMTLTVKEVQDADWENNWKQYYQPIAIGERLLVVPEWLETEAADRVPLVLDPGLAFGTGSHATTRMCLKQLDKRVHGGERVLDLGCGAVFCPLLPCAWAHRRRLPATLTKRPPTWPMKTQRATASERSVTRCWQATF